MKFEKAMANVVMFQNEDVVTTSCTCTSRPGKNKNFIVWTCTEHHKNIETRSNATSCGNSNCNK